MPRLIAGVLAGLGVGLLAGSALDTPAVEYGGVVLLVAGLVVAVGLGRRDRASATGAGRATGRAGTTDEAGTMRRGTALPKSADRAGTADVGDAAAEDGLPNVAGLGDRVGQILRLAEEQAADHRAEARRLVADARAEARRIVDGAHHEATAILDQAHRASGDPTAP